MAGRKKTWNRKAWTKAKLDWVGGRKLERRKQQLADFRLRHTHGAASDVRRIDPASGEVIEIIPQT